MKILHIDSSPLTKSSSSRRLSRAVVDEICRYFPKAEVNYRDLGKTPPPHLREETFLAFCKGIEPSSSEEVRQEVAAIYSAIAELSESDVLVIGAPMFNHSVTSQLKSWIDLVCQAGVTFRFSSLGAVGLLKDRPTFIVSTRGGIYTDTRHLAMDHQEPYLLSTLELMGITSVHILRAEGVDKTHPGRTVAEQDAVAKLPGLIDRVFAR